MAITIPAGVNMMELLVQATSPYNDGWTREFYQEQYDKARRQQDMIRFSQSSDDYELPPHTD